MDKSLATREKLLIAARDLFWTRGYSNVSVRQITKQAGVDAALVSRYFGGKQGLFEATLAEIPPWHALEVAPEDLMAAAVVSLSQPFDSQSDQVNPFNMLMVNVMDPEMGETVRGLVKHALAEPLAVKIGGENADERAAMLLATLFGMALMRKGFQLDAILNKSFKEREAQMLPLVKAALHFGD